MSSQDTNSEIIEKSNDHLQVKAQHLPHCMVKLEISVDPKAVQAAYQKAKRNINKEASVPGFRKGKAPDKFIEEKFGNEIKREWMDLVLQTSFQDAIDLTGFHPLKDGHLKRPVVHECSQEKGAQFTIEFETRPTIPSIDLSKLQLKKAHPEQITEKHKKDVLQRLTDRFTDYTAVTERGVEPEDYVDIDIELLENPPKKVVDNQRTQVNKDGLPYDIHEKLIGLKAGETAEGETKDTTNSDPNFQPTPFRVTVKSIWKGVSPELDDELAKKMGSQTVSELQEKISAQLEKEAEESAFNQQIRILEDRLLEQYNFELPQSIIDAERARHLENYKKSLNADQNKYYSQHRKEIEKKMEEDVTQSLQLFFILQKIARDNQINVSEDEVKAELQRQIALIPSGMSQINLYSDNIQEQTYNLAYDRKVKQFLLDKATYVEG